MGERIIFKSLLGSLFLYSFFLNSQAHKSPGSHLMAETDVESMAMTNHNKGLRITF